MSQGGARDKNLGNLKKNVVFFLLFFIESFVFERQVFIRTGYLCVISYFRVLTQGGAVGQN